MQEMLEKFMTERKTALASVFEKLFCICLNKNGFYFSPNLNRNINISCFYKPAQPHDQVLRLWVLTLVHRTLIQIKKVQWHRISVNLWVNTLMNFLKISTSIDIILYLAFPNRQSQSHNIFVKYKWTGFICCERYIFKYLELERKRKKGRGKEEKSK